MTAGICDSIIIIGGGVAGLSAAIALRQKNPSTNMTIIEAYPGDSNKRLGLGMMLMDNGIRALKKLRADGALLDAARAITHSLIKEADGKVIVDESFDEIFCCSRRGILDALESALKDQVEILGTGKVERVYKKCSKVELSEDCVTAICFTDGSSIAVSPRDLVLACDGVHSMLCSTLNKKMKRSVSQVNEVVTATHAPSLAKRVGATFRKTNCVEDGLAYGLLAPTESQVIGFVQFDTSRHDVPTTAEEKRALFHLVVSKITDPDQRELFEEYADIAEMDTAHVWKPVNSELPTRLHIKNGVLMGDAAHPLLPFTSQGTCMALDDAIILAHVIGQKKTMDEALKKFVQLRTPVANEFIKGGREILEGFVNAVPLAPYVVKKDDKFRTTNILHRTGSAELMRSSVTLCGTPRGSRVSMALGNSISIHPKTPVRLSGRQGAIHGMRASVSSTDDANKKPLFGPDQVDLHQLSKKAYNYRWATLPESCIPLTAADSDFRVAEPIQDAIVDYVREGYMNYTPAKGLPALREEIGYKYSVPSDQVFVTSAAASSMFLIMKHLLTQPGDEVIIADPVDFLFQRSVEAAGGVVRRYKLQQPKPNDTARAHWSFDIADVEVLISDKTKVIGICNPHNPVGRVWNNDELKKLTDLAVKHDLKIWSDEVWADLSFVDFTSTMHLSREVAERTYTVYGFSKGYGLAGLRLGCIIAPTTEDVFAISKMSLADDTAYGVSALSQVAGIAALQKAGYWQYQFKEHVKSQCQRAVDYLNAMPHVHAVMPEGTFVVFANVSYFLNLANMDEESLCKFLIANQHVALVPGSPEFFGPSAAGHIRLSVATSEEVLDKALNRLKKGLDFIYNLHCE